ncbi:MAG: zf-HC2 domain-containing protein [Acidobacteriota bacterium]
MAHDMTCKDFVDQLIDFIEGGLAEDACRLMREHQELCPPCLDYAESYRATAALAAGAYVEQEAPALPEDFAAKLLKACCEGVAEGSKSDEGGEP